MFFDVCPIFPITVPINAASPTAVPILFASIPNIFLTIPSEVIINDKKYIPINIFAIPPSSPGLLPAINFAPILPIAKYVIQWNGWINILYANSFNQEFNACDFPSPILSIEYVIVINGAIIIKNAAFNILFKYNKKNIIVININTQNATAFAQPIVNLGSNTALFNIVFVMSTFSFGITSFPALYIAFTNPLFIAIIPIII